MPQGIAWSEIEYGNDTFVALAYAGAQGNPPGIMHSTDAITWTQETGASVPGLYMNSFKFGNGKWVETAKIGVWDLGMLNHPLGR